MKAIVGLSALVVFACVGACATSNEPDGGFGTGGTGAGVGGTGAGVGGTGAGVGGTGAGVGGTVAGAGGTVAGAGGGGAITGDVIFTGEGAWVDGTVAPASTYGIQGSFFVLEDSVKDGVPADGESDMTPNAFDDTTVKPCISGTAALVTCSTAVPPVCNYSTNWGGGIGMNLNEEGGVGSVPLAWNATTNGVTGFSFTTSGNTDGATMRVKAKDSVHPLDDFCLEFTVGIAKSFLLSDLTHNCYAGGVATLTLDTTKLTSLQWQIVTDTTAAHTVTNFCIESLAVTK